MLFTRNHVENGTDSRLVTRKDAIFKIFWRGLYSCSSEMDWEYFIAAWDRLQYLLLLLSEFK